VDLQPPASALNAAGILLRLMRPEDTATLRCREDLLIRHYLLSSPEPTDGDAAAWVQLRFRAWTSDTGRFAIADEQSDELLGSISFRLVGDTAAQIGFWIGPSHRRRGHAIAALELVTNWLVTDRHLALASMLTDLDNVGSQRVAARAGFSNDGAVTDYEVMPGVRRDVILWSRAASDRDGLGSK
jgi:RimJ/RimL family protein N-acetyltransferase